MANFDYGDYLDSLVKEAQNSTPATPLPPRDPNSDSSDDDSASPPTAALAGLSAAEEASAPGRTPMPQGSSASNVSRDVADFIKYKQGLIGDDEGKLASVRDNANSNNAELNLAQAAGDFGAGLAGTKVDPGYYNAARDQNAATVKGAEGDVERNRKLVQDFMNNKRAEDVARENRAARLEMAKQTGEMRKANQLTQLGEKQSKRLSALGDAIDENKGRTGELGRQIQFVNNADRVLTLKKQFPDGNLPAAQMAELATASAGLLGGGTGAAEHTISRFVPKSASGDVAKLQEWLESEPKGAGQQAFAKQMFETAEREKALAQDKVKGAKYARVAQFSDLQDNAGFNSVLQSHGIEPSEYETYKNNGFKLPDNSQFPKQVRNGNQIATVKNQAELEDAATKGFR